MVFTNGCFDVVHRGHIEFLKFCKSQGDILTIGLNSDSSVKTIKGPDRPINNQHDRAAVLAALETVDYITIFDERDRIGRKKASSVRNLLPRMEAGLFWHLWSKEKAQLLLLKK
ncbi:MAG: adenylyltransferase/cytidyltransferase family protein [Planctomycetota bacterium]